VADSLAIDAPLGDAGSLPDVGSSLVAALDALGHAPIAVPTRGMQLSTVVLPSLCEGFGLVGLEALAHGRALIATGWSGPADYVDTADCVVLSARRVVAAPLYPGHAREVAFEDLVEALRAVAQDRDGAALRGAAARARVIERWSWVNRVREGYLAA